jgi:hypothetical protein
MHVWSMAMVLLLLRRSLVVGPSSIGATVVAMRLLLGRLAIPRGATGCRAPRRVLSTDWPLLDVACSL